MGFVVHQASKETAHNSYGPRYSYPFAFVVLFVCLPFFLGIHFAFVVLFCFVCLLAFFFSLLASVSDFLFSKLLAGNFT